MAKEYYINTPATTPPPNFNSYGANAYSLGISFEEYQKLIENSFSDSLKLKDSPIDLTGVYSSPRTLYAKDVMKLQSTIDDIDNARRIIESSGKLVGFDTETIGLRNPILTEVGYSEIEYLDGSIKSTISHSMPVALDKEQGQYLNNIIQKFRKEGFEKLTSEEKGVLEWSSRYSNLELGKNIIQNADGTFEIIKLNPINYSPESLDSAYRYLTNERGNKPINPRKYVKTYADMLGKYSNDPDVALYGANQAFDIGALKRELERQQDTKRAGKIAGISDSVIDIVSIDRATAAASGITPGENITEILGIRVPGVSVEQQMKARASVGSHLHISGADSLDEGRILINQIKEDKIYDFAFDQIEDVTKYGEAEIRDIAESDIFYFHSGSIDKTSGRDFAIVNGEIYRNTSITKDFWRIDPTRSGATDDGLERITFINYTDELSKVENPTAFSIERTHEEMTEFLNKNAYIYSDGITESKDKITKKFAREGQALKLKDLGRREFAKMLDPSSVAFYSDPRWANGYDKLKLYLDLYDKLNADDALKDIKIKQDTASVNLILSKINEYTDVSESIKKMTGYDAQAFVGMYQLLDNERDLLSYISEQIEAKGKEKSNLEKTIYLKNAYDAAIEELDRNKKRPDVNKDRKVKRTYNNIDYNTIIVNANDTMYRIDTMDRKAMVNSINRALDTMSYNTDSMGKGGILDKTKVSNFIADLKDIEGVDYDEIKRVRIDSNSDYNYDLAQRIAKYISVGAYGDYEGETISEKLDLVLNKRYSTGNIKKIYDRDKDDINNVINDVLREEPEFTPKNSFKEINAEITQKLNYSFDKDRNPLDTITKKLKSFASEDSKEKLITLITQPESEKGSAFLITTRQQDYAKLADKISRGEFDLTSWSALKKQEDSIFNYGMVMEIPYINKYNLGDDISDAMKKLGLGNIATVSQGRSSKFIIPSMNVYTDREGKLKAYLNPAEFDVIFNYNKVLDKAAELAQGGEYSAASSLLRRSRNSYLNDMASSSTYYNTRLSDGTIKRIMTFSPSDYLQAFRMNILGNMKEGKGGLYEIFGDILTRNKIQTYGGSIDSSVFDTEFNEAQKIVYKVGMSLDREFDPKRGGSIEDYLQGIYESPEFKEFFQKNIFIGSPATDKQFENIIGFNLKDQTIFQTILEAKGHEKTVEEALEKINSLIGDNINQIISETSLEKGDVSVSRTPGSYNTMSSMINTMRPQYGQSLNSVMFTPDEFDIDLGITNPDQNIFRTMLEAKGKKLDEIDDIIDDITGASAIYGDVSSSFLHDKNKLIEAFKEDAPEGMEYYAKSQTNFMSKVTFMSDFDLQRKYLEKTENAIANNLGLSEQEYLDVMDYMAKEYSSFAEDKTFISPGLAETQLFRKREAKKIELNLDKIDINKTRALWGDSDVLINYDTPIAIDKNGRAVFFNTPDVILDDIAKEELLSEGRTLAAVADYGDSMDVKLTIGGAEKSIAHSISVKSFKEYMGAKGYNYDISRATEVANAWFYDIFGSSIAGNVNFGKHGNLGAEMSRYYSAILAYSETDNLDTLVTILNSTATKYDGINKFTIDGSRIVPDWEKGRNIPGFIEDVISQLTQGDGVGDLDSNVRLIDMLDEMKYNPEERYYQGRFMVQRQAVNEHMGKALKIDWRIQQGMLSRGIEPGSGELDGVNRRLYELLRERTGAGTTNRRKTKKVINDKFYEFDDDFKYLAAYVNQENIAKGKEYVASYSKREGNIATTRGISLVSDFITNPKEFNTYNKVLDISINDLLNKGAIPYGVDQDIKELESSLFLIDGRYSKKLTNLMEESNVRKPYALRINIGENIKINGVETDNIVIPIQNINTFGDNDAFFTKQAKATRTLLEGLTTELKNPGKKGNHKQVLENLYSTYSDEILKQFNMLDKDSDIVKYLVEYEAPNSRYLLAQDEGSMITTEMLKDKELTKTIDSINRLKSELFNEYNADKVKELDDLNKQLDTILEKYAVLAERGELVGEIASNTRNRAFDASYLDIDGKRYFGPVAAVSRDTLRTIGADVNQIGLEAMLKYERGNDINIPIPDDYFDAAFKQRRANIVSKLNQIDGLVIDENFQILPQIERYLREKNDFKRIDIKKLNKARVAGANDDITAIFNAFAEEGEYYMERVGVYGEFNRSPAFRGYPFTKITLDTSMHGNQVRLSNGLFSVITNIDFDGDIAAVAAFLDGSSLLREDDELYQFAKEEWERYTIEDSPKAIAELIRGGDAFKTTSYTIGEQLVSLLKIAGKEDVIETALRDLAVNNNLYSHSLDEISKSPGLSSAVFGNYEFATALLNTINKTGGLNMVTDEDMIKASLAAKMRKAGIGHVSTSSFKARDNLLRALNAAGNYEGRVKILQTYDDLSNMSSKFGGLFSGAEQMAIDTKKALDGLLLSSTSQYSSGLSDLTRPIKNESLSKDRKYSGVKKILDSIGTKVFDEDLTSKDIEFYAELASKKDSYDKLDNAIKSIQKTGTGKINGRTFEKDNLNLLTSIRGLVGLHETAIGNEAYQLGKNMQKFTDSKLIMEELQKLSRNNPELAKNLSMLKNSSGEVLSDILGWSSKEMITYENNMLYFIPANELEGEFESQVFLYADKRFLSLDTFGNRNDGLVPDTDKFLEELSGIYNRLDLKDPVKRSDIVEKLRYGRVEAILNSAFIDNAKLDKLNLNASTHSFANYQNQEDNERIKKILGDRRSIQAEVQKLADAYNIASATNNLKENAPDDAKDLIKALNKKIANNPNTYNEKIGAYDDILKTEILDNLLESVDLDNLIEEGKDFQGVNIRSISRLISSNTDNFLNVEELKTLLKESFDELRTEQNALTRQGITPEILESHGIIDKDLNKILNEINALVRNKSSVIDSVVSAAEDYNKETALKNTQEILSKFKKTSQLDTFFGLNTENAKIGFGQYIGQNISDLSSADIKFINSELASLEQSTIDNLTDLERYMYESTKSSIENVAGTSTQKIRFTAVSDDAMEMISHNRAIAIDAFKKVDDLQLDKKVATTLAEDGRKVVSGNAQRRGLGDTLSDVGTVLKDPGLQKKALAAGGILLGIGIVNNLLHNKRSGSPLVPASDDPNKPDYNNNGVSYEAPSGISQAPASIGNKVIYTDNNSGLQFKVSGKTSSNINTISMAQRLSLDNSNVSINNNNDDSKVTDNWLENKFAQLMQ